MLQVAFYLDAMLQNDLIVSLIARLFNRTVGNRCVGNEIVEYCLTNSNSIIILETRLLATVLLDNYFLGVILCKEH